MLNVQEEFQDRCAAVGQPGFKFTDAFVAGGPGCLVDKLVRTRQTTDARLKKRIVRAVIKEVVADLDAEAGEIILFLHWMGGIHTELRLPRRRRGQRNSTSQDIVTAVRQLVLIVNDELIAGISESQQADHGPWQSLEPGTLSRTIDRDLVMRSQRRHSRIPEPPSQPRRFALTSAVRVEC